MKKGLFQRLLPHLIAVVVFLIAALIFCSPALSGKVINQSDVVHWKGMAQNLLEYKEQFGHYPLWTTSMFGGMPAYSIAIESQNIISAVYTHSLFTLFLPKPISFFFLICVSFYFLCQVFRINSWISILAALAYGYASYSPIIVAVGHDTKMLSMGYVPALVGALVLLYEGRYWLGGALTVLFTALLIGMNHLQISYYFLIIAVFMSAGYVYKWIKEQQLKHLALALSIALIGGIIGVLANATNIFVTYDYSKATMRNGTLSLDTASNGQTKKAGLPIDYAFGWSYGKAETFTLLVPGVYGGSSSGELDGDSKIAKSLTERGVPEDQAAQFAQSMPAYWGPQPGTSGPVYLGAIMCFLFLFGMVYLKTWQKWWILAAVVFTILLSWGKNFEAFNTFLFNNLPFYNKFRAPSMSLVVPQLLFPLVGAMTLQRLFFAEDSREEKWKAFKLGAMVTGGVLLLTLLMYFSFDYKGENDQSLLQYFQQLMQGQAQAATDMYNDLRDSRKDLFGSDLLRSIILIALAAGILAAAIKNKLSFTVAIAGLIILNVFDLFGVGKRYLNEDNFVEPDQYDAAFAPSPADVQIKQDTGYYRVLNLTQDVFNDAITSYHHNSVGGYHPAKLSITEDLLTYQLRNKQPMNFQVLNMLNTKYIITGDQQSGQPMAQQNPEALGAAWFVKGLRFAPDGIGVMNALDNFNPRDTAVLAVSDQNRTTAPAASDSTASITLVKHDNDQMIYRSSNTVNGFGVFSEIFYDRGWKAYIDGKETPIIRTNYVLRGLNIPAGQHEIRFDFRPASYYTGETIALIANIIIFLLLIAAAFQVYRRNKAAKA
ncbi:MAG TPA: YfhO family protein [Chitinophagaceae bacterium]